MSKSRIAVATLLAINAFGACTTLEDQKSSLGSHHNADTVWQIDSAELVPYNLQGRYSDILVKCIYPQEAGKNCSFDRLPLLHHDNPTPGVEDIMDRLVISYDHPWIADNFRMFLEEQPDYFLELFSSVTAVVIADKIQPSYYHSQTGAIHIDPRAYLWLSTMEKESLTHRVDDRVAYGSELKFEHTSEYEIDGVFWLEDDEELHPDNRLYNFFLTLTRVLFHELAHARDIYYTATFDDIDMQKSPYQNSDDLLRNGKTIARRLEKKFPFGSTIWTAAQDTFNFGNEATFALGNANVLYMMEEFQNDVAILSLIHI